MAATASSSRALPIASLEGSEVPGWPRKRRGRIRRIADDAVSPSRIVRFTSIALTTVLVLGVCARADASVPNPGAQSRLKAHATYKGKGTECENNAPHWACDSSTKLPFSFVISRDRKHLATFSGRYSFYCGGGTATLTFSKVAVSASGQFTAKRHWAAKSGNGTEYASLSGRFRNGGKSATLWYLSNFVYAGSKPPAHPYSPNPEPPIASVCASWVKGTAKVA